MLLIDSQTDEAEKIFSTLSICLSKEEKVMAKTKILEAKGLFTDAIDALMTLKNEEGFLEEHTSRISYYHLKNGNYKLAKEACKELLDPHKFSERFEVEMVNYEFAKSKEGNNVNEKRLRRIIERKKSKSVVAVSHLLLGEKAEAMKIMTDESEKDFSNLDEYLSWPITESVQDELNTLKARLVAERRSPAPLASLKAA